LSRAGMVECWNIGMMVFGGNMSFVDLPVKRGFDSSPLSHFSRTDYSIFHYSLIEFVTASINNYYFNRL